MGELAELVVGWQLGGDGVGEVLQHSFEVERLVARRQLQADDHVVGQVVAGRVAVRVDVEVVLLERRVIASEVLRGQFGDADREVHSIGRRVALKALVVNVDERHDLLLDLSLWL